MLSFQIIGLMSGTSLDGVDLAFVTFKKDADAGWQHQLLQADTFAYSPEILSKLHISNDLSGLQLMQLDQELGVFYADCINQFILRHRISSQDIDAISSHGHTIFHQPAKGLTVQIGCGATIAARTGIRVVNDFRKKDVCIGGQGAPLVPIGDLLLFGTDMDAFLNIGGFANVSFRHKGSMKAFDICPGNLPLNKLARSTGVDYDRDGHLARSGEINFFLLDMLNQLDFYSEVGPKSLGVEWLEQHFYPLIKFDKDIENNLRTIVEHEAIQIAKVLQENQASKVLVTGGGALNSFLIERIRNYFQGDIQIPDLQTIQFKEAIIFALLGALRLAGEINCLSSVTGARHDVCSGTIHEI